MLNAKGVTNCPNCGAPITTEKCPYCGTIFYDFSCIDFSEPSYIKMERDLAGFPVLYAPEGLNIWDENDEEAIAALERAEMIVSSIRRDAREGLVLPGGADGQGWKLELLASNSKRQYQVRRQHREE